MEKEKLQFRKFQLTPQGAKGGLITLVDANQSFQLSPLQYSYLDVLKNGLSIEDLVQFFLGQGWLIQFRELYSLIQFLVTERVIVNKSVIEYFKKAHADDAPMVFSSLSAMTGTATQVVASELPFFRSLEPALAKYLLRDIQRFQVPAQIRLAHAGQLDRDLFIILKGQANIYKVINETRRHMVATLNAGSLFG
ncbi:MAG TPA: cyclic nucleotide-binding domain-containing protein, partial [Bdellovibrio sp.]|nr:cyclic nucleotide-binding domain-containing protein [Bdellovibrio sp.]